MHEIFNTKYIISGLLLRNTTDPWLIKQFYRSKAFDELSKYLISSDTDLTSVYYGHVEYFDKHEDQHVIRFRCCPINIAFILEEPDRYEVVAIHNNIGVFEHGIGYPPGQEHMYIEEKLQDERKTSREDNT